MYETERLAVRRLDPADLDAMLAVYGDKDAMRWVDDGEAIEREECLAWVEVTRRNYETRGYGMSAVALRETGEVIGFCGIVHPGQQPEAELKYAFLREHWGKGLATETVRGMIAYGAEHFGIERYIATTAPENTASHRVLEKAGMVEVESREDEDGSLVRVFEWTADS